LTFFSKSSQQLYASTTAIFIYLFETEMDLSSVPRTSYDVRVVPDFLTDELSFSEDKTLRGSNRLQYLSLGVPHATNSVH
jgi:hypothetical protein